MIDKKVVEDITSALRSFQLQLRMLGKTGSCCITMHVLALPWPLHMKSTIIEEEVRRSQRFNYILDEEGNSLRAK